MTRGVLAGGLSGLLFCASLAVAQDQAPPLTPPPLDPPSTGPAPVTPRPRVRLRLQLQSRFQPHYQTRSGRPGRESSFAYHTRRDCASAVSPRNAPEPAPVCRGNGVRRLDRTRRPIDISRFLVATHRATSRRP